MPEISKEELFKFIKWEIDYCEGTAIKINPAFATKQTNVLDLIEMYNLSQYRDGNYDSFGNPRVFFNIVNYPTDVSSKMVDLDVKDVQVISEDDNYWNSWIMQKELHYWMKEKYFGDFLNQLCYNLPKYGHVVAKKVEDRVHLVPLKNLRFRPDVWSLKNVPIIERHTYQPDEFLLEAKKKNWENVDLINLQPAQVVDNGVVYTNPKLEIFEAYFPPGFLKSEYNYFVVSGDGIVLTYANLPQSPYKDMPWERVRGRTLGRGVIEKLFHEQIYINRLKSEKSDGLMWTSKHIFQTRDNSIAKNLLSQVENGDVLIVNDEVKPVETEERNLAFYNDEEVKWENQAYRKTFVNDQQQAPGSKGKPANAKAQMAGIQMQSGYFKQKKEEIANFVKEIIWDWVLPEFKADKKGEHKLILKNLMSGDAGSDKLFQFVVSQKLEEKKFEMLMNLKPPVMGDEEKVMKALIGEQVKSEEITIEKSTYDDLKFKIDIIIGNESVDLQDRENRLMTLLNMANNNPALFTPGEIKTIKRKAMEAGGLNYHDYGGDDPVQSLQDTMGQLQQKSQGGSLPRQTPSQMPQSAPAMATT